VRYNWEHARSNVRLQDESVRFFKPGLWTKSSLLGSLSD